MSNTNNEYTSIDFLSKIRLQPKKQLFKQLSLDTDLEQINQVLSPKAKIEAKVGVQTIDRELTKRFVFELIKRYENEEAASTKWQSFIKSIESKESFQTFVSSLKEIKQEKKGSIAPNPQSQLSNNQLRLDENRKRSSSVKKNEESKQKNKQKAGDNVNYKKNIRDEISNLKDLMLAGQKFIRENMAKY